jgi:hypothetical protein
MALKYKDKVYKAYRYHKLVWDDENPSPILGFRRYHYEEEWSVATYGPVFRFRYDPVPGVKHWKNSIRPYYRTMRTHQEIRWYYAHKDEVRIRGKRTPKRLPNDWDDFYHARREKGWKRTKKRKQWMKGKGGTKRVTSCHDYGISHGCDAECPALLGGDCAVPEEVLAEYEEEFTPEEFEELKELYNLTNKKYESIW